MDYVVRIAWPPVTVLVDRAQATVDVGSSGAPVTYAWAPAAGATHAEVDSASVSIGPGADHLRPDPALLDVGPSGDRNALDLELPRATTVTGVTLHDLEIYDLAGAPEQWSAVAGEGDLSRDERLVVSALEPDGAWGAPFAAAPSVPVGEILPPIMRGGHFSGGHFSFPPLFTRKLRVQVVRGALPVEFVAMQARAGRIDAHTVALPEDLTLAEADGAPVWARAGVLPSDAPDEQVDLRAVLQRSLQSAVTAGEATRVTLSLTSATDAVAHVRVNAARGRLLRRLDAPMKRSLRGLPRPLDLPGPPVTPGMDAAPARLRVRYLGERVITGISDRAPAPRAATGPTLGAARVDLPPQALIGWPVGRVGILGRALEDTELTVRLRRRDGEVHTSGVVAVPATQTFDRHWVVFEPGPAVGAPVDLDVEARGGRFLWATGPDGERPSFVITVRDPDPGRRHLTIGEAVSLPIRETDARYEVELGPALEKPIPRLESPLLLDVEVGTLEIRYERSG